MNKKNAKLNANAISCSPNKIRLDVIYGNTDEKSGIDKTLVVMLGNKTNLNKQYCSFNHLASASNVWICQSCMETTLCMLFPVCMKLAAQAFIPVQVPIHQINAWTCAFSCCWCFWRICLAYRILLFDFILIFYLKILLSSNCMRSHCANFIFTVNIIYEVGFCRQKCSFNIFILKFTYFSIKNS